MKIAPLANYRASLHFLIVGRPGTGKTYSLLTLPRPLLIIDAEGGLTTIVKSEQNLEQIDVVNVTDFDELEALLRSEAIDKYASIAIDTYSTLQSFHVLKRSMGANRESLPWSEWNYVLLSLKNLFYNMRKKNCILVVNIHERLDKDTFMPLLADLRILRRDRCNLANFVTALQ